VFRYGEGRIRNSKFLALLLKYFARAHIWVYRRTNGRPGAKLLWFPTALLTTTGRKTGRPRITSTLYLRDGDRIIVPASFGGRDRDPLWYRNLGRTPRCTRRFAVSTSISSPAMPPMPSATATGAG
jgi:F420H(2)-dependent quinone reductase